MENILELKYMELLNVASYIVYLLMLYAGGAIMTYTIKNNKTNREYKVESNIESIDMIWLSEKCWFMNGCSVTITNENGESRTYTR